MWLRIKKSPSSGERDRTLTTEFGGSRYSVGPEPVKVSAEVGDYLSTSFSGQIEVVPAPPQSPKAKRTRKSKPSAAEEKQAKPRSKRVAKAKPPVAEATIGEEVAGEEPANAGQLAGGTREESIKTA